MTDKETKPDEPMISCKVCMKDIPESVAQTHEGEDYVVHFCGLDCYQHWHKEQKSESDKTGQ